MCWYSKVFFLAFRDKLCISAPAANPGRLIEFPDKGSPSALAPAWQRRANGESVPSSSSCCNDPFMALHSSCFAFYFTGRKKKINKRTGGKEGKFSTSTDHSLQVVGHASAVFDKQGSSVLGTWTLDAVQLKLQLPSFRIFGAVTGDSPSLNLPPIPFCYFVVGCCSCSSPSLPEC